MNILHILSSDDKYGSAQCFLELLKRESNTKEIQSVIITPCFNNINKYCDSQNITNYVVKYRQYQIPKHNKAPLYLIKYIYHFINYYKNKKRAINQISKIVEKHNIDIIHTNTSVIDIGANVSKIKNIPHAWHLREFGEKDFNFHSVKVNYIKEMNYPNNNFIAISDAVKNTWVKKGIKENKITTIYDGIDIKSFNEETKEKENKIIKLVMVGAFCEAKGQAKLIKAIKLLDDFERNNLKLYFYGKKEGTYYKEIERLIKKLKLRDVVTIKGYSSNIPLELEKYDVGVVCSRAEAFGRVTVEYMMAGLCTVVPRSGANIEIVEKNNCGITYKYNDTNDLTRAIRYIINNKNIINKYSKIARDVVKEKFDINKNYVKIIDYFKDIKQGGRL